MRGAGADQGLGQSNQDDNVMISNLDLNKPEVYFGAMDGLMETFQTRAEFKRTFVLTMLFLGDVSIPDSFLYASNYLWGSIKDDKRFETFVVHSLRNSAITPFFREDCGNSFVRNLKNIQETTAPTTLHPEAMQIADFFERSAVGIRRQYRLWPRQRVSVGYRQILERTLLSDHVPEGTEHLEKFWDQTQEIRSALIGEITPDDVGGFRRLDIYTAAHQYVLGKGEAVETVRDLWNNMTDAGLSEKIHRMLKWVNYCYYYNQGVMFQTDPGLSNLEEIDIEFSRHLALTQDGRQTSDKIEQMLLVPSTDAILTVDPNFLFELRNSEIGENYFKSVRAWQQLPTDDTTHQLLDSLTAYTEALHNVYITHGRNIANWAWLLRALVPVARSRWGRVGLDVGKEVATAAIEQAVPFIGLVSAIVGRSAAALYESLPMRVAEPLGRALGINRRVRIMIEPDKRLVTENKLVPKVTTDAAFNLGAG
jgi:hypothetical protein